MRVLNDEEISQILRGCDYSMAPAYYTQEDEPDEHKEVAKAQFHADIKWFIELLENLPHDVGHFCLGVHTIIKSLKQLVEE